MSIRTTTPAADPGRQPGALFTDLYELVMADALVVDGTTGDAEFEIFFRSSGPLRPWALLAGTEAVLAGLEDFRFSTAELEYLEGLQRFHPEFLDWLQALRFTGDVDGIPEGSVVFADEPLLRVRAPLPLGQILETRVMNALHYATVVATKAARITDAAAGRAVVDFGARRAHGHDAAVVAARAAWVAGFAGTSNMVAGQVHGLPVVGTMAHSYVQAMEDEYEAFRSFTRHQAGTVLLVDTYDTHRGVENVIRLAREQGDDFAVRGIRIDSGDLDALARMAREMLDRAGLRDVQIVASGGLDEHAIHALTTAGAPIDQFGVGTDLVVSRDAPTLDFAYKLVSHQGRPTFKTSPEKVTLPGAKQVFRRQQGGVMQGDVITSADASGSGEALLQPLMRAGERTAPAPSLADLRDRATAQREALPTGLHFPADAGPDYPVEVSAELAAMAERLRAEMTADR